MKLSSIERLPPPTPDRSAMSRTSKPVRSKFVAMLQHRCPRCHSGKLFGTSITSLQKPFLMHRHCPECFQSYYPEPGFYYGAMFISYIITAFYCLGFVGVCILLFGLSVEAAFGLLLASLLLFYIWFYRMARAVWIHINMRYDAHARENARLQTPPAVHANRNF